MLLLVLFFSVRFYGLWLVVQAAIIVCVGVAFYSFVEQRASVERWQNSHKFDDFICIYIEYVYVQWMSVCTYINIPKRLFNVFVQLVSDTLNYCCTLRSNRLTSHTNNEYAFHFFAVALASIHRTKNRTSLVRFVVRAKML